MRKKLLSLFLAFVLLLGQTPMVFAADEELFEEPAVTIQETAEKPEESESVADASGTEDTARFDLTANSYSVASDAALSVNALGTITTGTCGDNLTWTLEDGVLTISGTGDMYDDAKNVPWKDIRSSVVTVVIEEGVTGIGSMMFEQCEAMISLTIPSTVTSIGFGAFLGCLNLPSITVAENNPAYCSVDGVLFTKDRTTLICYPAGKSTTHYVIPDSVTCIENYAFFATNDLRSVTIPNGVTTIGYETFGACVNLIDVTIPKSVTMIQRGAFSACSLLETVYYGGTESDWANITIENSNDALLYATVVFAEAGHIHDTANGTCSCGMAGVCGDNLIWVLENGTLTISGTGEMDQFTSNTAPWYEYRNDIKNVIIEEGVMSVGDFAFSGCLNLETIKFPESLTVIGEHVTNSLYLTSISIPKNVHTIGDSAFENCNRLAEIEVDPANKHYVTDEYGVLFTADMTFLIKAPASLVGETDPTTNSKIYTVPDTVTRIYDHAFAYCTKINCIVLPKGLTTIPAYAFTYCSKLNAVHIPNGVTAIEEGAFYIVNQLRNVYYYGSEAEWEDIGIGASNSSLMNSNVIMHYICELEGHRYGTVRYEWGNTDPACSAKRECEICGSYEIGSAAIEGKVEKEAGCTEVGSTRYTATFTEPWAETQYKTYWNISALGHDEIKHDAKAPTCTEIGWDAYVTCSRCDYTTYTELPAIGETYWMSDINGDGRVNVSDLNALYRYVGRDSTLAAFTSVQLQLADINGDGRVNVSDLNALYRYVGRDSTLTWTPYEVVIK